MEEENKDNYTSANEASLNNYTQTDNSNYLYPKLIEITKRKYQFAIFLIAGSNLEESNFFNKLPSFITNDAYLLERCAIILCGQISQFP